MSLLVLFMELLAREAHQFGNAKKVIETVFFLSMILVCIAGVILILSGLK